MRPRTIRRWWHGSTSGPSSASPDAIYWCDGTNTEYYGLCDEMVKSGLATRLNSKLRPDCVLFRSDPSDVARVEARTFIASEKEEDAGPTNHWIDPKKLKAEMTALYKGCMHGRTMYVIRSPWDLSVPISPRSALRSRTPLTL